MLKYAICKELFENKSSNWLIEPWVKKGAKFFNLVSEVPDDYILLSIHFPPWRRPFKDWIDKKNSYIEIDYGYWGENVPRRNSRRVTFNNSHNLKMRTPEFSRIQTLVPLPGDWKKTRGENILIIEPQENTIFERTGKPLVQWKLEIQNLIASKTDRKIQWRRKAGGKNPNRWSSFLNDLKNSHIVVGERTMACVEAVILGYPAFTIDFSAVSLIMGTSIDQVIEPFFPDRVKWLEHISWSQFYPEEFALTTFVADCVERYQIL